MVIEVSSKLALSQNEPACVDTVFRRVKLVNVFTGEVLETNLAVSGGKVVGWGDYRGKEEFDLAGKYICPGFIDGHVHIESSLLMPAEFARAVVPLGTTTVVADPHEVANVCGLQGIEYMLAVTEGLPLDVFFMLPAAVPASPFEAGGAVLTANDLALARSHPRVLGLGEVMDFESVLAERPEMMAKLALFAGGVVDGHAPGLTGARLQRYIAQGIRSDHECVQADEALEKLRLGMYIMLRESSASKNLLSLLPAVTAHSARRCMFVTDDRHPVELREEGHINHLVHLAVMAGIDPMQAIQMATINSAEYFGLRYKGALAPGYEADFLVLDNLREFRPLAVYKRGVLVAQGGQLLTSVALHAEPRLERSIHIAPLSLEHLRLPADGPLARVIGLVPGQIATQKLELEVPIREGCYIAAPLNDIHKLAVIERHFASGQVGLGLVSGFGLTAGAIASSVAHDSHNVIVLGADDADMVHAVEEVVRLGGGLVLVEGGAVLASLALPVAGLMSVKRLEEVAEELLIFRQVALRMGVRAGYDPYMTLSFLSLPVVPELKLTSRGLVDVTLGQIVPVSVTLAANKAGARG